MAEQSNAALPKNDRELLLNVSGKIGSLVESMDRLNNTLSTIELKRIEPLEKKVDDLQAWKDQFSGAYKFVLFLVSVGTIISLVKAFLK